MALATRFTSLFGVEHPVALAPMGGTAGGALAAAVARGGGLGLLGSGDGDPAWLAREAPLVSGTGRPWGIGFLTWAIDLSRLAHALTYRPHTVMLSFGDPTPYVPAVRAACARLILQVTSLEEAAQAADLGADVIVAQGTEAGGHGAQRGRSTLPFVPLVVDRVAPIPVLAAGGIADGRGLAAALALGAEGALIGTRFQATAESLVDPAIAKALLEGHGADTVRSSALDLARGSSWPARYTARTLPHPYLDRPPTPEVTAAYQEDLRRGAILPQPPWAGEAVDFVTDLPSAAELVPALAVQAEEALARVGRRPDSRQA
jgi:nitronate monooxygenase